SIVQSTLFAHPPGIASAITGKPSSSHSEARRASRCSDFSSSGEPWNTRSTTASAPIAIASSARCRIADTSELANSPSSETPPSPSSDSCLSRLPFRIELPFEFCPIPVVDAVHDGTALDAEAKHAAQPDGMRSAVVVHGAGHRVRHGDPIRVDDELFCLVVEVIEPRQELRKPLAIRVTPEQGRAEDRNVLVDEIGRHTIDCGIYVMSIQRSEIALDDVARAPARRHFSSPQSSRIVENTFWSHENSMTFPSGSLAAQMYPM